MTRINYLTRLRESWAVAMQTPVSCVCSICYRSGGRVKYFGEAGMELAVNDLRGIVRGHPPKNDVDHDFQKRLYKAAVAHLAAAHGKRLQRNPAGSWRMVTIQEQGAE